MNVRDLESDPGAAGVERRSHLRYRVEDHRVAICGVRIADQVHLARVMDVSRAGVLVSVPEGALQDWPALRQRVDGLTFSLDGEEVVRCAAEVAWFAGSRHGAAREYRCGLAFVDLTPEDTARLSAYLDSLPPAEG